MDEYLKVSEWEEMNGCVIHQTPIAVDFWKIRECPQARIFFLTHLHGDHITGLTSSWNYPIYCSDITGKLLHQRYGVKEELIHVLQVECAEIIFLDEDHKEQMTVTAIDANHCPGAVMFLMEGYFGTILHSGDFRYHSNIISQSVLSQYSERIDILYLDNTYCSPGCVFPTREEATNKIIEIIEQHPEYDVLIAMRNLGKEELLYKIAMHFQEWISVPDKFYKTLEILEAPDVFDNNSNELRIRIVPFHKVSNKFVSHVNKEKETIVILPTALYQGIEATPYEKNDKVFVVPYSDHSSFTELQKFVSFVRPRKIIPIVKSNARGLFGMSVASRADMSIFSNLISGTEVQRFEVPDSVEAFMQRTNSKVFEGQRQGHKRKGKQQMHHAKKIKRGITYDSPVSLAKETQNTSNVTPREEKTFEKRTENLGDKLKVKKALFDINGERIINVDGDSANIQRNFDKRIYDIEKGEDLDIEKEENKEKFEISVKKVVKPTLRFVSGSRTQSDQVIGWNTLKNANHQRKIDTIMADTGNDLDTFTEKESETLTDFTKTQNTTKKRACKSAMMFVSESIFDNIIRCKTYSKCKRKKICKENNVGNAETVQQRSIITANWVLDSFESDETHPEEKLEDYKIAKSEKDLDVENRMPSKFETDNGKKKLKQDGRMSKGLKQSTLSKFTSKVGDKKNDTNDAKTARYLGGKLKKTRREMNSRQYCGFVDADGNESSDRRPGADISESMNDTANNVSEETEDSQRNDNAAKQRGCDSLEKDKVNNKLVENDKNQSECGEFEHEDSHIDFDESLKVQIGSQVKKVNNNVRSNTLLAGKSKPCGRKVYEQPCGIEQEYQDIIDLDTSSESYTAQFGTQRQDTRRLTDVIESQPMVISDDESSEGGSNNRFDVKPADQIKDGDLDNSLSTLGDENTDLRSKANQKRNISKQSDKLDPGNLSTDTQERCCNSKHTDKANDHEIRQESITLEETEDIISEDSNERSEMNISIDVNIGTQKDVELTNGAHHITIDDIFNASAEKQTSTRKCGIDCSKCALEAFTKAFNSFEIMQSEARLKTLYQRRNIFKSSSGSKLSENCRIFSKSQFRVKPYQV